MSNDNLDFYNSTFIPSTIRKDDGVDGAIFVDTILIRDSNLKYGDEYNKIPAESIKEDSFINALKGLLVFNEHPREMITSENYNKYASISIGTITNAEYRENENEKVVYGTMRITNPNAIELITKKIINGGSLGYKAHIDSSQGIKVQKGLKPNHFCITQIPRDSGVKILNSSKGAKTMDKSVILEAMSEFHNSRSDVVSLDKGLFVGFMQTLGARIQDKQALEVFNSKSGVDKLVFLDSVLTIKDVFNSDSDEAKAKLEAKIDELETIKKELEAKNSELEEKLKENTKCEVKDDEPKGEDEKDEPKANEDDKKEPTENTECEKDEPKANSVRMEYKEVKNSNKGSVNYNAILNQI